MGAIKATAIASFLKSIPAACQAILVYGPDEGLVSERATAASAAFQSATTPPGELIRLGESDLETEPERLAVELGTIAMFGGRRIVRTSHGRRVNGPFLKSLLDSGPLEGRLVVEAGALKSDDAVRLLFERQPNLAALPCYPDEGQDLANVIDAMMRAARCTLSEDARMMLADRLGADRGLSRSEIDKLVLYVGARRRIEVEDVEAIVGDAAAQSLDLLLGKMMRGERGEAVAALDRALAAGENPQALISSIQRHLTRLHRVLADVEQGRSVHDVVRGLRPPLHFKAKDALLVEAGHWTAGRLASAVVRSATALRTARRQSDLQFAAVERLVLETAALAGQARTPTR
jgi:DNA polymerase-3 subunit delta